MGIKLSRKKEKTFLVSAVYRLTRILPLSRKKKFRLFLNLEWIFERLSHEHSFKNYDLEHHPIRVETRKYLARFLKPENTVLDLGCHEGQLAWLVSGLVKQITGVDNNAQAIEKAKQQFSSANLEFVHADALAFLNQKEKGNYDVLLLSHMLEHLDHAEDFLKTFAPYFKYVYIELPDFDKNYLNHYRKEMNMPLVYTDADHVYEFDRYEMMDLLKNAGLEIVSAEYIFGLQRIWCKVIPK